MTAYHKGERGAPASPELIDAIRRAAAAKKSLAEAADELTTRLHPLTRSAVAGIANRNGITFSKKARTARTPKRKPKDRRTIPARLPVQPRPAPVQRTEAINSFVVVKTARPGVKPPGPRCSWNACTEYAEPGEMFCFGHGRKGLMTC